MQVSLRALVIASVFATSAAAGSAKPTAKLATCRPKKARVANAGLESATVVVCFEVGPRTCWGRDLTAASGSWIPVPPTAFPEVGACGMTRCDARPPAPTAKVSTVTRATVCAPDDTDCHTVSLPPVSLDPLEMVTSEDRGLLAVIEDNLITTFDARAGKRAAMILAWNTPDTQIVWHFDHVRFLTNDRLIALRTDGFHTVGRILNARTGAMIAELADGANLDRMTTALVGSQLAVATLDGGRLAIYERDGGDVPIRTVPLFPTVRVDDRSQGLALLVGSDRVHEVIAVRAEGDGAVAIYDATTGLVRIEPGPPMCP